jgi:hypothetical protein
MEGVAGVATIRDGPFWRARKTSERALRLPQFVSLAGCQREGHSAPGSVRNHAGLGAIATARPAKRLAQVLLLGRAPPFAGTRRFLVSPPIGSVQKSHCEPDGLALGFLKEPLPHG